MMTPNEISHMRKLASIGLPDNDDPMSFCVRRLCDEIDAMRADAALGALVRAMPIMASLMHGRPVSYIGDAWVYVDRFEPTIGKTVVGDTPEEALKAMAK